MVLCVADFFRSHHVFNVKARCCISVWTNYSGLPTELGRRPDAKHLFQLFQPFNRCAQFKSLNSRSWFQTFQSSIASLRQSDSKRQGSRFKTSTPGSKSASGVKYFVGKFGACCLPVRETLCPPPSLWRLRDRPNHRAVAPGPKTVRRSPLLHIA